MALRSLSSSKLPIEQVLGNPAILHPTNVPEPSKTTLTEKGVHAGDVGKFQDFVVGDVVRPLYPEDPPEVTHVEGVICKPFLLGCIQGPKFAAIQSGAEDTGPVDCLNTKYDN